MSNLRSQANRNGCFIEKEKLAFTRPAALQPWESELTLCQLSLCALNFAGAETSRAYIYALVASVHNCLYAADVGLPGSVGLTVGVGNVVSEDNALTANLTLCHCYTSLRHSRLTTQVLYKNPKSQLAFNIVAQHAGKCNTLNKKSFLPFCVVNRCDPFWEKNKRYVYGICARKALSGAEGKSTLLHEKGRARAKIVYLLALSIFFC